MNYMKANGFNVLSISSDGPEISDIIQKEGVAHMIVPMTRSITPWQDLKCLWSLVRLFKQIKPDIVHSHTPKAGLLGMWAAKLAGVKVKVHTVAGIPWMESSGGKRILLKWMERLTYGFADRVYPNSSRLSDFIVQHKLVKDKKIKVIGEGSSNGIDLEYFNQTPNLQSQGVNLRSELGIKPHAYVYIFIGRIVKDKGINELVNAFAELHAKDNTVHLLLVGPFENHLDPISSRTQRLISTNKHIHTPGFQTDIRPWLVASDVLVFPSYREGFPNVPMQAGALELPVIASDINGCNEIITDGVNGVLIPSKNERALYEVMLKLKEDEAFGISLKANARSMIAARFEQKKVWKELLKEYEELLS